MLFGIFMCSSWNIEQFREPPALPSSEGLNWNSQLYTRENLNIQILKMN